MKIVSSQLEMQAEHTASVRQSIKESLQAWTGPAPGSGTAPQQAIAVQAGAKPVEIRAKSTGKQSCTCDELDSLNSPEALKVLILAKFIEAVTGKPFHFHLPRLDLNPDQIAAEVQDAMAPVVAAQQQAQQSAQTAPPPNWGAVYDYQETRQESESTRFEAKGVVQTADGQEISFDLQVNMSRELVQKLNLHVEAGNAVKLKDPLIVNFGRANVELSPRQFSFDLDADGQSEALHTLAAGSGFLALDRNGNGQIDNGRELFGPASGNGFAELASQDADHNGWIDEADPIYDKLRIWTPDANGQNTLLGLGQTGVGALYLGNLETPFALKQDTQLQGQIRQTGLFVGENGAGTIQMVDLAV